MTRMSLAERRQKLITAALAVIARHGVGAATTRAIAAEAQMPLASFHYAFASHQVLMVEALRTLMADELERRSRIELTGDDQAALVGELLGRHLADVKARPAAHQSILELCDYAFRTPGQEMVPAEWRTGRCEQLAPRLAAHAEQHGFRLTSDPEVVAGAVVTMADGLTQGYLMTRETASGELVIDCWTRALAS